MSYAFLVNSMGLHADLEIDSDYFVQQLKNRWPTAEIRYSPSPTHVLNWKLELGAYTVLGGLQTDGQTMCIEGGDAESVAEFAVWYRTLVSAQYRLFLYSGPTVNNPFELRLSATEGEIRDILNKD